MTQQVPISSQADAPITRSPEYRPPRAFSGNAAQADGVGCFSRGQRQRLGQFNASRENSEKKICRV